MIAKNGREVRKKKTGARKSSLRAPAFFRARPRRLAAPAISLRQVVTERREHHAVESVRFSANAGPHVAVDIGVLRSPLHAAAIHFLLRAVVHAEPEARGSLDQHARVSRAVAQRAGQESAAVDRKRL